MRITFDARVNEDPTMDTVMRIIACIPLVGWLTWRAVEPFMLCRDVEAGTVTRGVLVHLLIEAGAYIAIALWLMGAGVWGGFFVGVCGAMLLIGVAGVIRTVVAYARTMHGIEMNALALPRGTADPTAPDSR